MCRGDENVFEPYLTTARAGASEWIILRLKVHDDKERASLTNKNSMKVRSNIHLQLVFSTFPFHHILVGLFLLTGKFWIGLRFGIGFVVGV
jgi:hypothetical protein